MKFTIKREALLKPLQLVAGVVEKRQTLPVLSNVLINCEDNHLSITGTDLEVELVSRIAVESMGRAGDTTLPARKFLDICRNLPEEATVEVSVADQRATIKSGRSRFTLSTLPGSEFPNVEDVKGKKRFSVSQEDLRFLLDHTQFAMAQQDVRYYLNGMFVETGARMLRTVATDGHRLALSEIQADTGNGESAEVIVPRKAVVELQRLMESSAELVEVLVGENHFRVTGPNFTFTSKLVDGKYPDYRGVIPKDGNKVVIADRDVLRHALQRVAILSNEKYRGVRLQLSKNTMRVLANNPEQEEAEEEIEVGYEGDGLEIGFNVSYLLDVLSVVDTAQVRFIFKDADSSVEVSAEGMESCQFVVMPMRL